MKQYGFGTRFHAMRCDTDAEWRRFRREGIGGSDVASIIGLSPWRTPLELWMDKTGRTEDEEPSSEPMYWGNAIEGVVADRFAEEHIDCKVKRVNATLVLNENERHRANLDRMVILPNGKPAVLEIKTASSYKAGDWSDGVPDYYLTQVQWYLYVTGWDKAFVAVLIGGNDYREFEVDRDDEEIGRLVSAVNVFLEENVDEGVQPEVIGTSGEMRAMAQQTKEAEGFRDLGADESVDMVIAAYQDACERMKEAEHDKSVSGAQLAQVIGDSKGIVTDTAKVTFVRREVSRFDSKSFQKDDPDTYARYVRSTVQSGGLRVKEIES